MNWDEPREVKMIIYKHRTENVEILKELKELKNTITLPQHTSTAFTNNVE